MHSLITLVVVHFFAFHSFTIHIREVTNPEHVVRRPLIGSKSVLDAVESLRPLPPGIGRMDMWLVRQGRDGKTLVLKIDWAEITQRGRTDTNFLLNPGDRLMLQARFPGRE